MSRAKMNQTNNLHNQHTLNANYELLPLQDMTKKHSKELITRLMSLN